LLSTSNVINEHNADWHRTLLELAGNEHALVIDGVNLLLSLGQ